MVDKVGTFCVDGYLCSLLNSGYNYGDCINELLDNSIDAGAKNINIHLDTETNKLTMVDDGCGMDTNGLGRMFAMHEYKSGLNNNNHGKYGIGVKAATIKLSQRGTNRVLTYKEGKGLVAKVEWGKINRLEDFVPVYRPYPDVEEVIWKRYAIDPNNGTLIEIDCEINEFNIIRNDFETNIQNGLYIRMCKTYHKPLNEGLKVTLHIDNEKFVLIPLDPLLQENKEVDRFMDIVSYYKKKDDESQISQIRWL
jgi:hypothetical protein